MVSRYPNQKKKISANTSDASYFRIKVTRDRSCAEAQCSVQIQSKLLWNTQNHALIIKILFWGIYSTPTDLIKLLQNSTFPVGRRQKAAECCAKKPPRSDQLPSTAFTLKGHFGRRITATSFPLLQVHLGEKPFIGATRKRHKWKFHFNSNVSIKPCPFQSCTRDSHSSPGNNR